MPFVLTMKWTKGFIHAYCSWFKVSVAYIHMIFFCLSIATTGIWLTNEHTNLSFNDSLFPPRIIILHVICLYVKINYSFSLTKIHISFNRRCVIRRKAKKKQNIIRWLTLLRIYLFIFESLHGHWPSIISWKLKLIKCQNRLYETQ